MRESCSSKEWRKVIDKEESHSCLIMVITVFFSNACDYAHK